MTYMSSVLLIIANSIFTITIIGLQECLDLVAIRELILDHLGGASQFAIFSSEIGNHTFFY